MGSKSTGSAARQLACGECEAIRQSLMSKTDIHNAVHAVRKAVRRLRALLALLEMSELSLEAPDRALRRLGDGLSRLRDAHVLVETAETLSMIPSSISWEPILLRLQKRRDEVLQRALNSDPAFKRRVAVVERVQRQLELQPWETATNRHLRLGLARGERRVKKAASLARRDGDPENLHRWRRKVRRLRMQLEAVSQLSPTLVKRQGRLDRGKHAHALHKLGDALGWRQDLRMLRNLVRGMSEVEQKPALLRQVDELLHQEVDEV